MGLFSCKKSDALETLPRSGKVRRSMESQQHLFRRSQDSPGVRQSFQAEDRPASPRRKSAAIPNSFQHLLNRDARDSFDNPPTSPDSPLSSSYEQPPVTKEPELDTDLTVHRVVSNECDHRRINNVRRPTARKPPPAVTASIIRNVNDASPEDARHLGDAAPSTPPKQPWTSAAAPDGTSLNNVSPSFIQLVQDSVDRPLPQEASENPTTASTSDDGAVEASMSGRCGPGETTIKYNQAMDEIQEALRTGSEAPEGLPMTR